MFRRKRRGAPSEGKGSGGRSEGARDGSFFLHQPLEVGDRPLQAFFEGDGGLPPDPLVMDPGQTVTFTFEAPGTYRYQCHLHPQNMTGSVTVAR